MLLSYVCPGSMRRKRIASASSNSETDSQKCKEESISKVYSLEHENSEYFEKVSIPASNNRRWGLSFDIRPVKLKTQSYSTHKLPLGTIAVFLIEPRSFESLASSPNATCFCKDKDTNNQLTKIQTKRDI